MKIKFVTRSAVNRTREKVKYFRYCVKRNFFAKCHNGFSSTNIDKW